MNVLIAYASRKGSTHEVAEFMAQLLRTTAEKVTVAEVDTITSIADYDAVLMGTAIYQGMWLPQMFHFVSKFSDELATKPCFLWITCIRVLEPNGYDHAMEHYMPDRILQSINVQDCQIFAGKLAVIDVNMDDRWTLALHYDGRLQPAELNADFRDWTAIAEWTGMVEAHLKQLASITKD